MNQALEAWLRGKAFAWAAGRHTQDPARGGAGGRDGNPVAKSLPTKKT